MLIAAWASAVPALVQAQLETYRSVTQPDKAYDHAVAHPKRPNAAHGILSGGDYAQQRQPISDAAAEHDVLQTGGTDASPRNIYDLRARVHPIPETPHSGWTASTRGSARATSPPTAGTAYAAPCRLHAALFGGGRQRERVVVPGHADQLQLLALR